MFHSSKDIKLTVSCIFNKKFSEPTLIEHNYTWPLNNVLESFVLSYKLQLKTNKRLRYYSTCDLERVTKVVISILKFTLGEKKSRKVCAFVPRKSVMPDSYAWLNSLLCELIKWRSRS